ncbi:MAG: Chaperone protein DnaJ [Anaerolineales bacterium]|nr:Chaperone protein DnaJ [Anaerolineales bacterium]
MSGVIEDPYAILDIPRDVDQDTIKRVYFELVRAHPPETDPEEFKRIRAAYEKLRTPERRAQTDMFLLQPPPPTPNRRMPSFDLSVHREDVLTLADEIGWLSLNDKQTQ